MFRVAATDYLLVVSNVKILHMMVVVIGVQIAVTMMKRMGFAKTDVRICDKRQKYLNRMFRLSVGQSNYFFSYFCTCCYLDKYVKSTNVRCNKETKGLNWAQAKLACSLNEECLGIVDQGYGDVNDLGLCFYALQEIGRQDGVIYKKIFQFGKMLC